MLIYKKPKNAVFAHKDDAAFEFRAHGEGEKNAFWTFIYSFLPAGFGKDGALLEKCPQLAVKALSSPDLYYSAWLLERASGVVDADGKPHEVEKFDLGAKAELLSAAMSADPSMKTFLESHAEDAKKKVGKAADSGKLVGAEKLRDVQG